MARCTLFPQTASCSISFKSAARSLASRQWKLRASRSSCWPREIVSKLLTSRRSKRQREMSTYKTSRRIEFRDTDAAGIAHFSVFFTFMEEAEHEFLRHVGLSVHVQHEQ